MPLPDNMNNEIKPLDKLELPKLRLLSFALFYSQQTLLHTCTVVF